MSKFILAVLMLMALLAHAEVPADHARQIQIALGHHGVRVAVTGRMDAQTMAALKQLAKENNWQTRRVPDARVLSLIGLGAKHHDCGECVVEARR